MIEGKSKRNQWKLGKIVTLISGKDGRSRGAVVKTFDGEKGRYMKRPIERLYPIEVTAKVDITPEEIEYSKTASESSNLPRDSASDELTERPSRIAADNGILI